MKLSSLAMCGLLCGCCAAAGAPVTYARLPRKSLAVPEVAQAPTVDGTLDEAEWKTAAEWDDFVPYSATRKVSASTHVRAMRRGQELFLGVRCEEPLTVVPGHDSAIWSGDVLEIFFGGLEPEGWCQQFVVNAGGGRFCDNGDYQVWSARTSRQPHSWCAEFIIPLSLLKITDGACGFNICRQRVSAKENYTWSKVFYSFHEPENFGELLFCDYRTAALLRLGKTVAGNVDRAAYEQLAAACSVPAARVTHGPYLTNPTTNSMTINWSTAGKCAAFVDFQEANGKTWRRVPAELENGVVRLDHRLHTVHLSRLKPGTEYRYRLVQRASSAAADSIAPGGKFTTLSPQRKHYAFALFSDIHGDSGILKRLWTNCPEKNFDFCVNLGDMLSSVNGAADFFKGYLDMQTKLFAAHLPIVAVRGNHELRGFFAGGYFDLMRHPGGKTYYAFTHGPAFYLVLDGAADYLLPFPEFYAEQRQWLRRTIHTKAFRDAKFRIVLAHFPPCDTTCIETKIMRRIMGGLLDRSEPDKRIHLWLGGHEHHYFRLDPHKKRLSAAADTFRSAALPDLPFTVAANDGPGSGGYDGSIITVNVCEDALTVRAFDPDGKCFDSFAIGPDGGLKVLESTLLPVDSRL